MATILIVEGNKMEKLKIFKNYRYDEEGVEEEMVSVIEDEFNHWMENNPNMEIISRRITSSKGGLYPRVTLAVFYREKP